MKLHGAMTVVVSGDDMRRLVGEALCTWNLDALRVWKVEQAEGDKFVVELEPLPKPKPVENPGVKAVPK